MRYFFPRKLEVWREIQDKPSTMPISIAQLEMLAQHFRFDMDEARLIIGLPVKGTKKTDPISGYFSNSSRSSSSNTPSTSKTASTSKSATSSKAASTSKNTTSSKAASTSKSVSIGKRGPTGYNLYVKNSGISFKDAGNSWRSLSQNEKDKWNKRASSI